MPNYATLQVQLAKNLQNSRKKHAFIEHARYADNANFDRRLLVAASGYSTSDNEEAKALGSQLSFLDTRVVPGLESLFVSHRSRISQRDDFFGVLAQELLASAQDISAGAIQYVYSDIDGAIAIVDRRGLMGALRKAMIADGYRVVPNVITFGSFTGETTNFGALAVGSMSGDHHAMNGTLVFEVTDESVSAPQLSVKLELTKALPDGVPTLFAENQLRPERSHEDGVCGTLMTLNRSGLTAPTEVDPDLMFAAHTTLAFFATPKDGDTDRGKLYFKVTRQAVGNKWLIEIFRLGSQTTTSKVGSVETDTIFGTVDLSVVLSSGTVFSFKFDRAAAATAMPVDGNTKTNVTFDVKSPRIGDRWKRPVINDEAGLYATKIANLWRVSLPGTGASLFTDANAVSVAVT